MTGQYAARTRTFLAQIACGPVDDADFGPGRVRMIAGADAACMAQGQLCLSMAANLLARLWPVVQYLEIVLPGNVALLASVPKWAAPHLDAHIREMLSAVATRTRWRVAEAPRGACDCSLALGDVRVTTSDQVSFGSDGWQAFVAPGATMPTGEKVNPVGAYAAACLAVAEVWKRLLLASRIELSGAPVVPLEEPLSFSSLTYGVGDTGVNPDLPDTASIDKLTMIGLGAGGGAAAHTLASVPRLAGHFELVEPDSLDRTNHNRYVYAGAADLDPGRTKTEVVAEILRGHAGVSVQEHPYPFNEASLATSSYEYVLAAVHSREARRQIQMETPMVLWDAAAGEEGEFCAWRLVLGRTECMFCKHPPESDPERAKAEQLSRLLGLDATVWLRKLRDNEPFSADEVGSMRLPEDVEYLLPVAGQRFDEWEAAYCGVLRLPGSGGEVPVPFAPVMAGVLVAGEVLKQHHFPDMHLDSYYLNTLTGKFMTKIRPHRRRPKPKCGFCQDAVYLAQYDRRWGSARS